MRHSDPAAFKAQSAGHLINKAARLFTAALAEGLRPLELAPAQFMALLELWSEDGLTQGELVTRLEVEQATMASTLDRMQRDGLIQRRPHPRDGRVQSIHVTPRARTLQAPAIEIARQLNADALSQLSPAQQDQVLGLLPMVIRSLRARRRPQPGKL
jgi:DNA-binding MarR family transcriptional regulator